MNVERLLRKLVEIPSPSGEEKEIADYLVNLLKSDFVIKQQRVGSRFNFLAYRGKPRIILTTHLDTVPELLVVREDTKYIYGRGACDAKASMASMILAAKNLANLGATDFGLLFDVGEEDDFCGIARGLELVNPKFVIVGEPTNLQAVIGQKGLLGLKMKFFGRAAHGSTPERGDSAIKKMVEAVQKLNNCNLPVDKLWGKTTINIGKIQGGTSANTVPDYAELLVEVRTTKQNNDILGMFRQLNLRFDILYSFERVMTDNYSWLEKVGIRKRIVVPYFTEMFFWAKKTEAIVFGPGDSNLAHSAKERIRKKELSMAAKKYEKMVTYLNSKKMNKPSEVKNGNHQRL